MQQRVDEWTRNFFWSGFVVFLLASIPHIAAYFRHFDPSTTNPLENGWYWGIAYLLAIVIDLSDVLVSIAVMKAMGRGEPWYSLLGFWAFITLIMVLSWFFNWQYNVVFGTSTFHQADQISVLGFFTIGQINAVIGSVFQVLLLVYTAMVHKFSQKPKTAEELKAEADRLEQVEAQQKRIDAYHERNNKPGFIQRTKETLIEAKEAAKEVMQSDHQLEQTESDEEQSTQANEPIQSLNNEQSTEDESEVQSEDQPKLGESIKEGENVDQQERWNGFTSRSTVTIEKAAELLNVSINTIVTLRNKGTLKTAALNKQLITVASLKAYDLKRSHRKQPRHTKETKPRLKVLNNAAFLIDTNKTLKQAPEAKQIGNAMCFSCGNDSTNEERSNK